MKNQFGIDFDYPGLCALCHTEIAEFNGSQEIYPGIFKPKIKSFKTNMRTAVVRLDNNASMTVNLCENCYDLKPEDMGNLMESVINGWQHDVDGIPHWDQKKKIDHMNVFSKFTVIDRMDRNFSDEEKKKITQPDPKNLNVKVN